MNNFFGTIRVILNEPIPPAVHPKPNTGILTGYYVTIGIAAAEKKDAMQIISNALNDGKVDWDQSEWPEWNSMNPSIASKASGFKGPGIWYKSGRVFFGNEP
jgi:hypothetical protein